MNTQLEQGAHQRIGEVLIARGHLNDDQLRIALQKQKTDNKPLGEELLDLHFISEQAMREAVSEAAGYKSIDLAGNVANAAALALIPKPVAIKYTLFPISFDAAAGHLVIVAANPDDILARDAISPFLVQASLIAGRRIIPAWRIAPSAEVLAAIDKFYDHELSIEGILFELESGELDINALMQAGVSYSHPIVRLTDAILSDAVSRSSSDIHFEPEEQFLRVRYRIDGVLRPVRSLSKTHWMAILVRLKVLSGMNIAETRAPQDGRVSLSLFGRQIDFRAASHPTIHGENFVLRILDRKLGIVSLDKLGMTDSQLSLLERMLERPEGILLVTGPTGSGKTTTLYSILSHLNNDAVNIMTLEDPVEYPMPLTRQTSIAETIKLDFSNGIRSLMRQDPDIILVGEIRDHDTAEMALRAAMTGHQVFSTLHTNSAIGSVSRLHDLGIVDDMFASNLIGIIAQRLVRRLCPLCKVGYSPDDTERRIMGIDLNLEIMIYQPAGCTDCEDQGYKGRLAIMELLRFDRGIVELVTRRAGLKELTDYALAHQFVPLAEDGIRRVREGLTSLPEVRRVVDFSDRMSE
ncbi:GspE/PulE family protein [Gallionella capsiferriformans]|uniref:Type II secretion system protein E n=1 Tax=Gallionella capsiferriformans (strain ES-2) TaxID=395494 RepID=D9SJC9_GALCS|nr:type II/IV secretion system protein [Gallionella capsiferriformans]ADL56317.1 type II secretion system protein E [Gallionella capsiferriformans ES-2]